MEMEDKQLNELVRLLFSFSSSGICSSGSWQTAVILSDSGSMQLHTEPAGNAEFVFKTNQSSNRVLQTICKCSGPLFTYFRKPVHPFRDLLACKLVASVLAEVVAVLNDQVIHIPIVTASHVLHELSNLCRV